MNFADEFKRRVSKIDGKEDKQLPAKPIALKHSDKTKPVIELYSLIKIENGRRVRVGFGLTMPEAEALSRLLMKKMRKLVDLNESGGPLFEITLSEIAKEI